MELVTRRKMGRKRTRREYPGMSTQSGLTSISHIYFQYIGCNNIHRLATMLVYGQLYTKQYRQIDRNAN